MKGRCVLLAIARNASFDDDEVPRLGSRKNSPTTPPTNLEDFLANVHYQSLGKETSEDWAACGAAQRKKSRPSTTCRGIASMTSPSRRRPCRKPSKDWAWPASTEAAGWTRLVIEKPFGDDLASSRAWDGLIHRYFDEAQVYRIDHYLGKETVQNLLAFRFVNSIFESVWNRDHIASVQITVAESIGVDARGNFFDECGHAAGHDAEPPHPTARAHRDGSAHRPRRQAISATRR